MLPSREIDPGRGVRLEECEATIDKIAGKVGYARIPQIEEKGSPL